jgi:hypothetical protein
VLLQKEDGKEFLVAYVSRHLLDAETQYVFMEKLCLSLYYACSKFSHYILSNSYIVACQYDVIKHVLLKPILSGRIGKWAYALVEYDLAFKAEATGRWCHAQVGGAMIAGHGSLGIRHTVERCTLARCHSRHGNMVGARLAHCMPWQTWSQSGYCGGVGLG